VFVLMLAVGVLVPALSLLLPSRHEGYVSDDPDVLAGEFLAFQRLIRSLGCREGSVIPGFSCGSSVIGRLLGSSEYSGGGSTRWEFFVISGRCSRLRSRLPGSRISRDFTTQLCCSVIWDVPLSGLVND
jgi:hypothetical protein